MIKRLAMSEPEDAVAVKAKKASSEPSGAPRWTYVVAAIVGVVGMAWAIASHFIPKTSDNPKTTLAPPQISVTQENIQGSGNKAIGIETGGTSATPAPFPSVTVKPSDVKGDKNEAIGIKAGPPPK